MCDDISCVMRRLCIVGDDIYVCGVSCGMCVMIFQCVGGECVCV